MPLFEVETDGHIIITWADDEHAAHRVVTEAFPNDAIIRLTRRPRDTWVISKGALGIRGKTDPCGVPRDCLSKAHGDKVHAIRQGAPCLPYEKTILLDSALPLRTSLIPVGIAMLDKWDMAVPLMDYSILALHVDSEQERERTKAVIHDLRVPVYDTRLMFIKRKPETEMLIDNWRNAGRGPLAFLRELYKIQPFILALPCTWTAATPMVRND